MKIVVVESRELDGGRLVVVVPAEDIWAFQVLCARSGQRILKIEEGKDAELVRA